MYLCPHCDIELQKDGIIISPFDEENVRYIMPQDPSRYEDLQLVDCWKCHRCGYSEVHEAALLSSPVQYHGATYIKDL